MRRRRARSIGLRLVAFKGILGVLAFVGVGFITIIILSGVAFIVLTGIAF
jgi:hypothetical protein